MNQLLVQLNDIDETVRFNAAQMLGKRGDAGAVDGLVSALTDEHPRVKYAALSSLVKIGSSTAAKPTIEALLNDLDSRLWMLMALDIGMRLRNGLFSMVEKTDANIADLLVNALDEENLSENQRALIIRLIGRTADNRMVETFIDMLMIGSEILQGAAAEALGYIRDDRAVPPLIIILEDADSKVREIAIDSLGRIGNPLAGDTLLPLLDNTDEWTRRAAVTALGDLDDKRAVRKILRISREDESMVVREAADEALRKLIINKQ